MTMEWRGEALCAEVDTELFFPDKGGDNKPAKNVCRSCTVIEQCLNWALHNGEAGIWGGKSERERRRIAQERGIKPRKHWEHGDFGGAARHRREGTTPCRSCLRTENEQQKYRERKRASA